MDNPVLRYFAENLDKVSKEEILTALGDALLSANYWREACLLGLSNVQEQGAKGCAGVGLFAGNKEQTA